MKKIYTLFLFTVITTFLTAQVNLPIVNPQTLNHLVDLKVKKTVNNKTVNCTDTVEYPISKLTGLPEIDTMDITTYISGTAQVYYFSGTGTIHGISAHVYLDTDGIPGNAIPIIMTIKVYDVNVDNEPSTMIDSADVQVMDVGFAAQPLMFSSPVSITDTFAVALELNAAFPANPYYVTNTSANADGNGERLSSAEFAGVWYNAFDDFAGWDMDAFLSPIFTTDITSLYTVLPASVCPNDTITFSNSSAVNTDAMFNLSSSSNPLYQWNFDDGTGIYTPFDTVYAYSSPDSYNTSLTTTYYGYTQNCFETHNVSVAVHDTASANFGWMNAGGTTIQFSDSSLSAMSYSWDFGDADTSSMQQPSHSYASTGMYYVCLTVTDSNGCNTNTFCDSVNVISTSIENIASINEISIYPIPAKKYFNVSVPNEYLGGEIVLTDVLGQKIKVVLVENIQEVKILTDEISSGIYFVSLDYLGERVYTRRIVIDK